MKQQGSTIVIAMVFLIIISLLSVYTLESSNLQSKMVANSLFTTITYHECRNEQEAQVHHFNLDENNADYASLLAIAGVPEDELLSVKYQEILKELNTALTPSSVAYTPQSDIDLNWGYIKDDPAARGGYNIGTESIHQFYIYENDCIADFNSTKNDQTLGVVVQGLKQAGVMN